MTPLLSPKDKETTYDGDRCPVCDVVLTRPSHIVKYSNAPVRLVCVACKAIFQSVDTKLIFLERFKR